MIKNRWVLLLYILIAISIMAPMVSHDYVPVGGDQIYHLTNIFQAKQAILQGGVGWLRVAPTLFHGWFDPVFQFYSPSVYFIAGVISFISHNPVDPFKLTIMFAAVLGAWYSYKLYLFLFDQPIAAVLGGMLYLYSPYLSMNINVRGDFPESVTVGFLPVAIYYAFRLFYQEKFDRKKWYFLLVTIFVFYCLVTAHLITFLYSTLFLLLLLFLLAWPGRQFKSFSIVVLSIAAAMVLAAWYLIPLVTVERILNIGAHQLSSPWDSNGIVELASLLSIRSLAYTPWTSAFPFTPSLGLMLWIGVFYWSVQFGTKQNRLQWRDPQSFLLKRVLAVFFIVFFCIWSPLNFWQFLPHQAYVLQFSYRLLTDAIWLGGLLFVGALIAVFKNQLDERHLIVGGILIAFSAALWMHNNYLITSAPNPSYLKIKVKGVNPILTGELPDYLVDPSLVPIKAMYSAATNPSLLPVENTEKNCVKQGFVLTCAIDVKSNSEQLQLPILYYPGLLQIKLNGKDVPYQPSPTTTRIAIPYQPQTNRPLAVAPEISVVLAAITLPEGANNIAISFVGNSFANRLSELAWIFYFLGVMFFIMRGMRENRT